LAEDAITMYLKTDRDSLVSLHPDEIEADEVTFSENNIARCTREDGEILLEMYDFIWEHEPEDG